MNIFELLNNFFEENKTRKLSSSSTKLYFFLIYQANKSLKAALKSQVILIDDLGAKTYNWINDKIRLITDEANRNQKSLIISTNLNPKELISSLELRTASRLRLIPLLRGVDAPFFEGVDATFCAADGVVAFEGALIPLLRGVDSPKAKTGCGNI